MIFVWLGIVLFCSGVGSSIPGIDDVTSTMGMKAIRILESSQDELALCEFQNSTNILTATNGEISGWRCANMQPNNSICSWEGLTCSSATLEVTHWNLFNYAIYGTMPPSIGYMPALEELYLGSNSLFGSIPETIWSGLASLKVLHLSHNSLSGTLPQNIMLFSNLLDMDLSSNKLNRSIPSLSDAFPNLEGLRLGANAFTGPFPETVSMITKLTLLVLTDNQLTGPIPESICALSSLLILEVAVNNMLTCYPPCLPMMDIPNEDVTINLEICPQPSSAPSTMQPSLSLAPSSSAPTAYIATYDDIALCEFAISANVLAAYGSAYGWSCNMKNYQPDIPICRDDSQGNTPQTFYYYEGGNDDLVPQDSWEGILCDGSMVVTRWLQVEEGLFGTIPASVGYMPRLQTLLLEANALTGTIPITMWTHLTSIERLVLTGNNLTGTLPNRMGNLTNLQFLYVDHNRLNGTIPDILGKAASSMQSLNFMGNSFTGPIPYSLGNLTSLLEIDLRGNSLTGSIPLSFCSKSFMYSLRVASGNSLSCYPVCLSDVHFDVEDFSESLIPCTEAPTAVPTISAHPTLLSEFPTAAPTTLYDGGNLDSKLDDEIGGVITPDDMALTFSMTNDPESYTQAVTEWWAFVENNLDTDFNRIFHFIETWSVGLEYGSSDPYISHFICNDTTVASDIVSALIGEVSYGVNCNGIFWSVYADRSLCVGCSSPVVSNFSHRHLVQTCNGIPSSQVSFFVPNYMCQQNQQQLQIISSAILFENSATTTYTVPIIRSVQGFAGRFSATVSVNISLSSESAGGTLYCAAFLRSTSITSDDQVRTATTMSYHIFDSNDLGTTHIIDLVIMELVPITEYSVYCSAEDAQNDVQGGTSVNDILATRLDVTTICCRLVSISYYPKNVISTRWLSDDTDGAVSNSQQTLITSTADINSFVFRFRVDSAPFDGRVLIVRPVFYYYNATTNSNSTNVAITASPSNFNFTSGMTGSQLAGSFVVTGEVSGLYYVVLVLEGTAGDRYRAETGSFTLSSVYETPPLPQLSSVVFGRSGRALVLFDSPTDYGVSVYPQMAQEHFSCSLVLTFDGDSHSSCVWLNASALLITFQVDALTTALEPGGHVGMKGSLIRSYYCLSIPDLQCNQSSYSNVSALVASISSRVTIPTVRLIVDSSVDSCSPIFLDASSSVGSGGRPWKAFLWNVVAAAANATTEQTASALDMSTQLNSLDVAALSSVIQIDASLHKPGTYQFTLTLYNFLLPLSGAYRFRVVSVEQSGLPQVRVSIRGRKDRIASVVEPFAVSSVASWNFSSTCSAATSYDGYALEFAWKLYRNYVYVNVTSTSNDPRTFALEPYTLEVGYSYQISLQVTVSHAQLTTPVSTTKFITVTATSGRVHAAIAGGEYQVFSSSSNLLLDASYSVDEGIPDAAVATYPLSYQWTCAIYAPSDMFGALCGGDVAATSDTYVIPSGVLSSNFTYLISVLVMSSYHYTPSVVRSATKSVLVDISDSDTEISASISSLFSKFNANEKLEIEAVISGASYAIASWQVVDSTVQQLLVNSAAFLSPLTTNFTAEEVSVGILYPFVLREGALTGGITYTFQLSVNVTGTDGSQAFLVSTITLSANVPPSSGIIEVLPSVGSDDDIYVLSAAQWTDDISDYPLMYRFHYYHFSNSSTWLVISSQSELSFAASRLPPGLETYDYIVVCVVLVEDLYGAVATAGTEVIVTPSEDVPEDWRTLALEDLLQSFTTALNTSDYTPLMQAVQYYTSILNVANCSGAPDCSSLNRLSCTYLDHTCGDCDDGFTSVAIGNANLPCARIESVNSVTTFGDSTSLLKRLATGSPKECPSAVAGAVCSGHGVCTVATNTTDTCEMSDYYCQVVCICEEGYAGSNCGLTSALALEQDSMLNIICHSIGVVLDTSDISNYQVQMLTDATLNTYEVGWMITLDTIYKCANVVSQITALMAERDGPIFLTETVVHITDVLSTALTIPSLNEETLNTINDALNSVNRYVQGMLADGELPFDIITENVKISVRSDLLSGMGTTTYHPPQNSVESLLEVNNAALQFNGSGLSQCSDHKHYVRFFVSAVNDDVYGRNNQSVSTIFQIGSALSPYGSSGAADGTESSLSEEMRYTLVIPLRFNVDWTSNLTTPACQYLDSRVNAQRECPCTIVALTAESMTLNCIDDGTFCRASSVSSTRRKLKKGHFSAVATSRLYSQLEGGGAQRVAHRQTHRRLDFDYTGQERASTSDGDTRLANYQALATTLLSEFVTVSANPAAAEWQSAWPLFLGVCVLFVMFIMAIVYFSIWDETDRLYTIYQQGKGGGPAELFGTQTHVVTQERMKAFIARENSESNSGNDADDAWMPREPVQLQMNQCSVSNQGERRNKALIAIGRCMSLRRSESMKLSSARSESFQSTETSSRSIALQQTSSFTITAQVKNFFESVIPASDLIGSHSFVTRFYGAMISGHDVIRLFTFPSLRLTRVLRFVKVVCDLLLLLFVDCLFYGILFPDDGETCRKYDGTSEAICLKESSYLISGETLCEWNEKNIQCDLRPPPSSFVFYIIVSLFITVVTVLPSLFSKYLVEEICICRPKLEDIGMSTEKWFRVGVNRSAMKDCSGVKVAVGPTFAKTRDNFRASGLSAAAKKCSEHVGNGGTSLYDDAQIRRLRYFDFNTVEDELYYMSHFIMKDIWLENYFLHLPWRKEAAQLTKPNSKRYDVCQFKRTEALQRLLHLQADGSAVPLNCVQSCRYQNTRRHIKQKIIRSRRQAANIIEVLTGLDDHSEGDEKNAALMQYFIVEQFSPFKRLALRRHFFKFDELTPDSIPFWKWFCAWAYLSLSSLFFLYWILIWAATHGPTTSIPWFIQVIVFLVQEVIVNESVKVYLVDVLALELLRPQLALVNDVLVGVASSKFQLSKSSDEYSNAIVQHVSGACRAARSSLLAHLPAAQVLQRIDDHDALQCRRVNRQNTSPILLMLVLFLTILALASDVVHDTVLELLIPSVWCMFLVGNALVISVNKLYLVYIYIVISFLIVFYALLIHPVKSFLRTQEDILCTEDIYARARQRWTGSPKQHAMVRYEYLKPKSTTDKVKADVMGKVVWIRIRLISIFIFFWKIMQQEQNDARKREKYVWQNMNLSAFVQGHVVTEKVMKAHTGKPVSYPVIRRGYIPKEVFQMTKANEEDISMLFGCVRLKRVLSDDPYQLQLHLPIQCPPVSTIRGGAEMLMIKFNELLHSSFGIHEQPENFNRLILVLPAHDVCDCASYVLSSFHINGTLLTDQEFKNFANSLSDVLTEQTGYLDVNSLMEWFKSCMKLAIQQRGALIVNDDKEEEMEDQTEQWREMATQTSVPDESPPAPRYVRFNAMKPVVRSPDENTKGEYTPFEVEVVTGPADENGYHGLTDSF